VYSYLDGKQLLKIGNDDEKEIFLCTYSFIVKYSTDIISSVIHLIQPVAGHFNNIEIATA